MPYNQNKIGYQNNEVSKEAADFNASSKLTLRQQVAELFDAYTYLTVEDVSSLLNRPDVSVRPRVTELKNLGYIQDSGERKMGQWGTSITLWELVERRAD